MSATAGVPLATLHAILDSLGDAYRTFSAENARTGVPEHRDLITAVYTITTGVKHYFPMDKPQEWDKWKVRVPALVNRLDPPRSFQHLLCNELIQLTRDVEAGHAREPAAFTDFYRHFLSLKREVDQLTQPSPNSQP
ncbi:hypothetical protein JCM8547_003354 [Rhodosporidiobolus lusitaniae]